MLNRVQPTGSGARGAGMPDAGLHGDGAAEVRVAIVGSGFSGLGMGAALLEAGIRDFAILERAGEVGGTWRDNTYPGCACDVPSLLYSYSFAQNPSWSRSYSPAGEIWDYLRDFAAGRGLMGHIRFGHDVTRATWLDDEQRWDLETSAGRLRAEVLVAAGGGLSEPSIPDIAGLESFAGPAFHSARWDHEQDLAGKRVAVVGTGASAIQIVPAIQPLAGRLHLFQRTPAWIVPRRDRAFSDREHRLFARFPAIQSARRGALYLKHESFALGFMHPRLMRLQQRLVLAHLRRQVPEPELRAKLTPRYTMGCKRILVSDDFYPSLRRDNVELVTDGIAEVRERSIVTADGAEREVDVIVLATGFHVTDMPIAERVLGRGGRTLADAWDGSPRAYKGVSVAGFPNLFMLSGPNTGSGNMSIVFFVESQIRYVMGALRTMRERGAGAVEVRAEAQSAYNAALDDRLSGAVWSVGGCGSWYLDRNGRNSTLWPGFSYPYRRLTRRFDPERYALRARREARVAAGSTSG